MAFGCKSGQICFYMGSTSVLICALAFSKLTAGAENDQTEPEKGPEKEQTDPVIGADELWMYPEEENGGWSKLHQYCQGGIQSPIDILKENVTPKRGPFLIFNKYGSTPTTMTLANEGETLKLSGQWASSDLTPSVSFGQDNYTFENVYFHWGINYTYGSEHMFDGQRCGMEMQVVHKSPDDQRLIISIFFKECSYLIGVSFMPGITQGVREVTECKTSATIKDITLEDIVPIVWIWNDFYWYIGSLTIPPCTGNVNWCLGTVQNCILYDQMDAFRGVKSKTRDRMTGNVRGVQQLNGREVYHISSASYFVSERKDTLILYLTCSLTLLIVAT